MSRFPIPDAALDDRLGFTGTSRIAEALIEAGRAGLSREELAARVDKSAAGGSFGTYLSRLASPGLIDRSGGMIRLTPEVFG